MASTELWHWRTAPDAAALEDVPPHLTPQEAQEWCNFTLWHPFELPAGCDTAVGTLRKEAPPGRTGPDAGRSPWSAANPAAFRTEIGGPGRRLRLKQFLYDWAFPAADHPALWGSETRHFPIGSGRVVWLGTDYLGHAAASARMLRTTVELSVLEGEFTGEELVELYRSLRPAVAEVPARVVRTPFSALSYWARHRDVEMVSVPTGLFTFHRRTRPHEGDWVPTAELARFLAARRVPASLGGFACDSAAVFADADGSRELEVIYTSGDGDELRLVLQRPGGGRMPFPPQREKHPARAEEISVDGRTVHLAYVDDEVGPFDAMWRDEAAGVEAKLLTSARTGLDKEFVLGCVRAVLAAAPLTDAGAAL
ncbi:hypothetical protein AB0G73_31450 [Streptomyces sp. NPDC020719]|uniref:hypothetical protein n=1 Tax=unclassified Streptomyces TaxID=2593676 RepID=UPI0033DBCE71